MRMWHDKYTQSPCHPCFIFEYVYPHTFHVNFLLKRYITHDHGISCTSYQRTDNKPCSGLIGQRLWLQVGQLPIKAGWRDVPLTFCNLAKAFKHYYIFGFHLEEAIKTITVIHYCYCLMVSGKWRWIIYWKANYIMILYQNVIERSGLQYLHLTLMFRTVKNLCPNLYKPPLPSKIPGYAPAF